MPAPYKIQHEVNIIPYELSREPEQTSNNARYAALQAAHNTLEETRFSLEDAVIRQVIPDTHADGSLLGVHTSIHGSIRFATSEDLNVLCHTCKVLPPMDATPLSSDERVSLTEAFNRAIYNPKRPVLSLGDETADRGRSDEIIMRFFNALEDNEVACHVLESNHGIEFSKFYHHCKKQSSDLSSWQPFPYLMKKCSTSLVTFEDAIRLGDIPKQDAEQLMERHLKRKRLLDAHLDEHDNLYIYVHAAIDPINTIRELCELFDITYDESSNQKLLETISKINNCYQGLLLSGELFQTPSCWCWSRKKYFSFTDERRAGRASGDTPTRIFFEMRLHPIVRCIWGREYRLTEDQAAEVIRKKRHFIFGHLGKEMETATQLEQEVFTCLDTSLLGRGPARIGSILNTYHLGTDTLEARLVTQPEGGIPSASSSSTLYSRPGAMPGAGSIPGSSRESMDTTELLHEESTKKQSSSCWCCCRR